MIVRNIICILLISTILVILTVLQKPCREGFVGTNNPYGIMNGDEIYANLQKIEVDANNLTSQYITDSSNLNNQMSNIRLDIGGLKDNIKLIGNDQSRNYHVLQESDISKSKRLDKHDNEIKAYNSKWTNLEGNVSDIHNKLLGSQLNNTSNYNLLNNKIVNWSNYVNNFSSGMNTSLSNLQVSTDDKYNRQSKIINSLTGNINTFNNSLTDTNITVKQQSDVINLLKSDIQSFQTSVDNVSKNYALSADLNNLKNNLTNLGDNISKTYAPLSVVGNLSAETSGLSTSLKDLLIRLSNLTGAVSTIQGSYVNQKDITNLTNTINNAQINISSIQKMVDIINSTYSQKNDLDGLKNIVVKQEASLSTLLGNSINAQQTASNLSGISAALSSIPTQSNITNLQIGMSNLSSTLSGSIVGNTSNVSYLNSQITNTSNSVNNISNNLTSLKTTVDNLNNIISTFQTNVQNTYANKNDLTMMNNTIQAQIKLLGNQTSSTSNTLGFLKTDRLQLGGKFSFSGVGDTMSNDNYLRLMDSTGSNLTGGLAMSQLYTSSNAYLNGNTSITGRLDANNSFMNNVKFSSNWTGYPDSRTNASEIANDTDGFKKLMIVGNKSGGGERRVGIWDTLYVDSNISSGYGLRINANDPGPMMEKNYGNMNDRYGIGQFPGGQTRLYTGTAYQPANINLGFAKNDGTFADAVSVSQDGKFNTTTTINNNTRINSNLTFPINGQIIGDGRLNIGGGEQLFVTNKNGLNVSKSNGGSGNLYTDGDIIVGGKLTVNGTSNIPAPQNLDNSFINNIKFSSNWTGYPDSRTNSSEIANDTNGYKQLMIVGNKSGGAERRVGIWDTLYVDSNISTNPGIRINNNNPGSLIEKNYGTNDNRYGIGQFPNGQTRVYTAGASAYQPASINMGFAKADGSFVDAVSVTQDKSFNPTTNINGNINQNNGQHYMNDNHIKLRGDNNHGLGYDNTVDGPNLYGYSGGRLSSQNNNTALSWDNNGKVTIPNKLQLGNKWLLSGNFDSQANDDWLRFLNTNGSKDYYGGAAFGKTWSATGYQTSDRTLKENIKPITYKELDDLDKLMTKSYNLKNDRDKKHKFGFISQDVQAVYPDLITKGPEGKQGLDYTSIIPLTVGNVQQLKKRINDNVMCIDDVCIDKQELKKLKNILKKN